MRRISEEYFALFRRAAEDPEGILVPFDTPQDSANLRSYLYHFRSQIRKSQPDFLDGRYDQLKFTVEPKGLRISIPPAPGGEAIRRAVR